MKKHIFLAGSALLLATLTTSAANAYYVYINNNVTDKLPLEVTVDLHPAKAGERCDGGANRTVVSNNQPTSPQHFDIISFPNRCNITASTLFFVRKISVKNTDTTHKPWEINLKDDIVYFGSDREYGVTVTINPGPNSDTVLMTVEGTNPDGLTTNAGTLSVGPL